MAAAPGAELWPLVADSGLHGQRAGVVGRRQPRRVGDVFAQRLAPVYGQVRKRPLGVEGRLGVRNVLTSASGAFNGSQRIV
jgi:hypothetical protein